MKSIVIPLRLFKGIELRGLGEVRVRAHNLYPKSVPYLRSV